MLRIRVHDGDPGPTHLDNTVGAWGTVDTFEPYLVDNERLGLRCPTAVYVGIAERDIVLRWVTWWWVMDGGRYLYTGTIGGEYGVKVLSGANIHVVGLSIGVTFDQLVP